MQFQTLTHSPRLDLRVSLADIPRPSTSFATPCHCNRNSHAPRICSFSTPEWQPKLEIGEADDLLLPSNGEEEVADLVESGMPDLADSSILEQMKEIVTFAGPATGLWLCEPLMSLIDTAVICQGSSIELAALGPGTVLCDYMSYVFMFLSIAMSNRVATALARQCGCRIEMRCSTKYRSCSWLAWHVDS